uniref:Cnidarian restricted protein n=1 Tax=Clytia hemisphaerica TaxID=252671 RepID=A0A7M6DLD3_9CNID|eukprot:TCONS_00058344-protein
MANTVWVLLLFSAFFVTHDTKPIPKNWYRKIGPNGQPTEKPINQATKEAEIRRQLDSLRSQMVALTQQLPNNGGLSSSEKQRLSSNGVANSGDDPLNVFCYYYFSSGFSKGHASNSDSGSTITINNSTELVVDIWVKKNGTRVASGLQSDYNSLYYPGIFDFLASLTTRCF